MTTLEISRAVHSRVFQSWIIPDFATQIGNGATFGSNLPAQPLGGLINQPGWFHPECIGETE
jgi:hypothetical protein